MLCLDTSKAAKMDQISVKNLKEAADILAYPLNKIGSRWIKVSDLSEVCKTAKLTVFKKGSTTDPKTTDLFYFCL